MSASEHIDKTAQEMTEGGFRVALDNFEGPFDLLLSLITKHELDITDVALSQVTDEFLAYLTQIDGETHLDAASEFIVVGATLLDMKIVSLLPQGDLVDAEDVAVLEARDLLFARLLQYRAFRTASAWFEERMDAELARHARTVPLEDRFREQVPELRWTTSPDDLAALAVVALAPKEEPTVGLTHLHAPAVSVREQAAIVAERLRASESALTFTALVDDADSRGVIVARFVAVLELYRRAAIDFAQDEPLGELRISWSATTWDDRELDALGGDDDG